MDPRSLKFVPGNLKTERICNEAMHNNPLVLWPVPDQYKTQEMRDKAVEKDLYLLEYVPDNFKTQSMCDKVVMEDLCLPEYVPDWFVRQEQIELWGDEDDYYDDDKLIEWQEDYQNRKAQKARIKEELMPVAWHPDRVMNWCMSGDEKGVWK